MGRESPLSQSIVPNGSVNNDGGRNNSNPAACATAVISFTVAGLGEPIRIDNKSFSRAAIGLEASVACGTGSGRSRRRH